VCREDGRWGQRGGQDVPRKNECWVECGIRMQKVNEEHLRERKRPTFENKHWRGTGSGIKENEEDRFKGTILPGCRTKGVRRGEKKKRFTKDLKGKWRAQGEPLAGKWVMQGRK